MSIALKKKTKMTHVRAIVLVEHYIPEPIDHSQKIHGVKVPKYSHSDNMSMTDDYARKTHLIKK